MTGIPALILDRDGVINVDHGYVHDRQQFDFIDGIFDLCRSARQLGYRLIVATNQSGVGRGLFSEADLLALHAWLQDRFAVEGAPLDGVYWCGHHPHHGKGHWLQDSALRKPAPGMLLQAAADHQLDLGRSVNIGDRLRDLQAGRRAGVGTNLLYQPGGRAPDSQTAAAADAIVTELTQIIPFLAERRLGTGSLQGKH